MAIVEWPQQPDHFKLTYNMTMAALTVVTGAWAQFKGDWLPFIFGCLWAGLWFWDLYLRPYFAPHSGLSEEEAEERETAVAFHDWVSGGQDRMEKTVKQQQNVIRAQNDRINKLEARVEKVMREREG